MKTEPPKIDWDRLRTLRDLYLQPGPLESDYWTSNRQLQDYDITLGERIGWKWDAVIEELKLRGWSPPSPSLTDLGCGTGVAARRMLRAFPGWKKVTLWDRSELALRYARQKIRHEFPEVKVLTASRPPRPKGVAVVSHVLTELGESDQDFWLESLADAQALLWVEPGTAASSRGLIAVREILRESRTVVAPCTHQAACGLLTEENAGHWCHHFAPAPPEAHQSSFWGHFRREMNLDIGPLAYSFLVLDRRPETAMPPGWSHLIGKPLRFPKFLRVLSCQEENVRELVASRKTDGYKSLKQAEPPPLYRFACRKNRITEAEHIRSGFFRRD